MRLLLFNGFVKNFFNTRIQDIQLDNQDKKPEIIKRISRQVLVNDISRGKIP